MSNNRKKIIFALIFIIELQIPYCLSLTTKHQINSFDEFNEIMLTIEKDLKKDNLTYACKNSTKAALLIEKNIITYKELEPYYDWIKIKELLRALPKQLCSK